MVLRRLSNLMRMRFRDKGGSHHMDDLMKQNIQPSQSTGPNANNNNNNKKQSSLLAESELSKRVLKRVQKLMHDAVHLQNPDMPDQTLTHLREEYSSLDWDDRKRALRLLSSEFGVDRKRIKDLIQHYLSVSPDALESGPADTEDHALKAAEHRTERDLRAALVPLYVRMFEQMNGQTGGLKFLVDLRADLLLTLSDDNHPALRALDGDMRGLFSTWLSPACLELHQITWNDAASLLEKIVRYEAVHPISNLYDLKRRLGTGRRCFGYFHPAMPGEPLVFIEVALTDSVSSSIQEVLFETPPISEEDATHAVFYSISSTQPGLSGIDLGNFLIKRVLRLVQQDMAHIKTFVTLSPIPGFLKWLIPKLGHSEKNVFHEKLLQPHEEKVLHETYGPETSGETILHSALTGADHQWIHSEKLSAALRSPLMRLCARYLLQEKKRGKALDPVANFHLRNGASIERLNWMGDKSAKGLNESAGMMVNYLYRVECIAENNRAYISTGTIQASTGIGAHATGVHQAAL